MAKDRSEPQLDRELPDLPQELRWREWMRRIEAVLFASATPVLREDLTRVVGQGASVDLLVEDLAADLEGRAFEIAQVAGGWMFRTRAAYAPAIRAAADGLCRKYIRRLNASVLLDTVILPAPRTAERRCHRCRQADPFGSYARSRSRRGSPAQQRRI